MNLCYLLLLDIVCAIGLTCVTEGSPIVSAASSANGLSAKASSVTNRNNSTSQKSTNSKASTSWTTSNDTLNNVRGTLDPVSVRKYMKSFLLLTTNDILNMEAAVVAKSISTNQETKVASTN